MWTRKRVCIMRIAWGCLFGTVLVGCGGGTSTPPPQISVSLSNISVTVLAGTTAQLTATVGNDLANKGVTWTLSCSAAPCGSVSPTSTASGTATTYTAPVTSPASDLAVTVTATSVADPTKSIAATISVPAITISVSPTTASLQINTTLQLTATVSNDNSNAGVTWTLTQNGTACSPTCGTVSPTSTASGALTTYSAPVSLPASNLTVTLTATSVADTNKSAPATITVPSVAVTVVPSTASVSGTGTTQLTATVAGDSSNKGVTWTVSCSTAPCGSPSPTSTASGVAMTYTAPGPPTNDLQVSVMATSVANTLATTTATVTVPAITVDVQPPNPTVPAGTTAQLSATVGNDLANKGVTWTLSCSAAPCGSVSPASTASGTATTYTAPATPPASDLTVTVTATSVSDTTKATSATVTVPAIKVSAISPPSGIIPINSTQDFTATVANDTTNAGVNWTLTQKGAACSPACGTVSPSSAASGASTTYTAPATVPTNATVTLNAIAAADTTKSSTATISLTSGTVKLIPATLAFGCKIGPHDYCPPPAQTITLTNTGSAALNLNGISVTGTNAAQFSETNNCAASVNAGASCTISVTFNPSIAGSYTASVSFLNDSPDSPQQVGLSAKATTVTRAIEPAGRSDLSSLTTATVPAPSGPEIVGTRAMHLTDQMRDDPYLNNGTKRELAVRFWYPASMSPNQKCTLAGYTSPAVWKYFSQLVGVPPFPVVTNSCQDAPIADGAHAVVVFTPGFTATITDYTFLMEDLASHGYIVASVGHTYETTALELSDGQLARSVFGSHLGGPMQGDDRSLSTAVYARLLDLEFVVNELERLDVQRDSAFVGKLDLSRFAVAGHSLGGLTALLGIELEPRFKAAILMDGLVPAALPSATKKPILILAADREHWEPTECHLWTNLQGPRLAVNLRGTEHVALGDWIWLTRNSVETGSMGPEKTMSAVRDYISAFLDANLGAKTLDRRREQLLTGPSPDYPDAAVTTQQESLCRHP
jgi:predicted dienelactone hydrolase